MTCSSAKDFCLMCLLENMKIEMMDLVIVMSGILQGIIEKMR